jgi:hypothetical protein
MAGRDPVDPITHTCELRPRRSPFIGKSWSTTECRWTLLGASVALEPCGRLDGDSMPAPKLAHVYGLFPLYRDRPR